MSSSRSCMDGVTVSGPPRRIRRNPHEELAKVPSFEQPDERLRRVLEAVGDIFSVAKLATAHPRAALGHEGAEAIDVIGNDEALDERAVDKERRQIRS